MTETIVPEIKPCEKVNHVYELTSKQLSEKFGLKGKTTSIEVNSFSYKDGEKIKTGYKIMVYTTDRIDLV